MPSPDMRVTSRVQIGGIIWDLMVETANYDPPLEDRFSLFCTEQFLCEPDLILRIRCGEMPDFELTSPAFETDRSWRLFRIVDGWLIHVRSEAYDPSQIVVLANDFGSGDVYLPLWENQDFPWPTGHPVGEILTTNLLARGRGVMFHACGINDGGNGLVFAGRGDSGKSTTSRLWHDHASATVLNDDKVIVRADSEGGDGFRVYGTPWPGQGGFASPESVPLQRIFLIGHAPQNEARRLRPAEAAARLLSASFVTFWDAEGMAFTLEFLDRLCRAVPCYELGFTPDQSAVEFVRRRL